jgi:NAD(P)-dependent dehydrogenase (short-subunit alcohol dehydrogenase family)
MPSIIKLSLGQIAPALRGLLAVASGDDDTPWRTVILKGLTDPEALAYAAHAERAESAERTDARGCPAPIPLERPALFAAAPVDAETPRRWRETLAQAIEQYRARHGGRPQVVALKDLGALYVAEEATAQGGPPLENRVALVTGAGGAIGHGICAGLLAQGAHVAAADLSEEGLENLVGEFEQTAPGRILSVLMDVTNEVSVERGFAQVSAQWGGVDIVVINAGIAHVAALTELPLETFQKLERVNVEGTLLTLAAASRLLELQGTGGDIVLVSTKNVFAPGARFGAYSATKAAAHQLARIASLELAEFDIRVNMVAPDGVFSDGKQKSGLWAAVGPDRMKARGLDEKGLEEYYRNRNLLKARITARHVANAVLFFVTRQTPTTGATIPIDGGLPDATPR